MGIEGLCIREEVSAPTASFRAGTPDVAEAVEVTIEAYKTLGFTPDVDQATEALTEQFGSRAALGYDGRLYVEPPKSVTFDAIVDAAEGKRAKKVAEVYRYPNLWIPGTEKNSYTTEELDDAPAEEEARLAVFNADENTGVDPLLHFLNMPYDDKYREGAPQTQLEALEAVKEQFTQEQPEAFLTALGHRATAMLVLMDRIRGVKKVDPRSAEFVLNRGFMRLPDLGRRSVDGYSLVGYVYSTDSQAGFDRSDGYASPDLGLGVSVGLNENPQTLES